MFTTKHHGLFHAVPYHLLSSMTVTQNTVRRESQQHRLVVLSCWFVSQQRSVSSLRLKVASQCGETRGLWQATPMQRAELQNTSGSHFWICNGVPVIWQQPSTTEKTTLISLLLAEKFVVNNGRVNRKRDGGRDEQRKRQECCVPVVDPVTLSNEQWAHLGEKAFGEA